MKPHRLIGFLAVLLAGCSTPQGELNSMSERRLALAPEVALYKYSRNLPLYDPARENAILASAQAQARARGINEETARRFFSAQMEASRRVQWAWFDIWRKTSPPDVPPRDLATDLRPRIDEINRRQIDALARGARPPDLAQLSEMADRFLPKN